jgi:hypothetical protein
VQGGRHAENRPNRRLVPEIRQALRDNHAVRRAAGTAAVLLLAATAAAALQRPAQKPGPFDVDPDYDGRVTVVRLRWKSDAGFFRGGFRSAWNHDYPRAEQHLSMIVKDITVMDIRTDADVVTSLDDPSLFNYPISLMWEPGFWNLTDREAESFRAYLLKGGLAIFEDFDGPEQWGVFESQMRRVLPEGRLVRLEKSHIIFDSFFRIKDIDAIVHPMYGLKPSYFGIFEGNDPTRRLMVVANFDNDVPEYWEWSGQGVFPFDMSNEAYKLGVNYVIYGMTH